MPWPTDAAGPVIGATGFDDAGAFAGTYPCSRAGSSCAVGLIQPAPVAEEAQVTAEAMGNQAGAIFDAGVAGIHRLMNSRADLPLGIGLRK